MTLRIMMMVRSKRQGARLTLVALFLAGGMLVWDTLKPVEADLAFRLPTRVKVAKGVIQRSGFQQLTAHVINEEGETVATVNQTLTGLLKGPVTPAVRLRLPVGSYLIRAELTASQGRSALGTGELTLEASGYIVTPLNFIR